MSNQAITSMETPRRKSPRTGTIIRIPLADQHFAYACITSYACLWIYGFVTRVPAIGSGFFSNKDWRFGAGAGFFPVTFVDCGKAKLVGDPFGENGYNPRFYRSVSEKDRIHMGYKHPYVVDDRSLSPAEVKKEKRFLHQWLDACNYESLIAQWRSDMVVREVPPEFIDKTVSSNASQPASMEKEPVEIELLIEMPLADLSDDEPEETFEEPLEEAVSEADCGKVCGSGTVPEYFQINVDTQKPHLRRCLSVIRRVLKKAKAPPSTRIIELCTTRRIEHSLIAPLKKK